MNKKTFSALVLSLTLLASCSDEVTNSDYYAFKSSSDGKWGMISPQGDVLFDEEFNTQPTDVIGGVFLVQTGKDDLWEIYDAHNNTTSTSTDSYHTILPFYDDVTLAVKNEEFIKIIEKNGMVKATLEKCGGDTIIAAKSFHDGVAIVSTKSGVGAVKTNGETAVRAKYLFLNDFSDHVAIGVENKYKETDQNNWVYSVINTKGETLLSIKASKYHQLHEKSGFHGGLLAVCKRDNNDLRWGFINIKGEEVIKPTAKNCAIGDWNQDVYVYSDGQRWGLKKISDDEILVRCKYDNLTFADCEGELLWAGDRKDSGYEWSLVNRKGEVLTKETYRAHYMFNGNYCPVQISENEWGFINKSGEEQKLKTDIHTIGGCEMADVIYSKNIRKTINQEIASEGLVMIEEYSDESNMSASSYGDVAMQNDEIVMALASYFGEDQHLSANLIDEYLFSLANHELKEDDIAGMPKGIKRILRNSIFARHGYIFKSEDLKEFFSSFEWYNPTSSDVSSSLSHTDIKNIDFLKAHE